MSCPTLDYVPPPKAMEVTFAGRSNVGKSSLLNALTGRKQLARTSNTPGRTQALNFFEVDEQFFLVDIPGYGYARASKDDIKKWHKTMKEYLLGRPNLRRVFLLIDSRHGIKDVDIEMIKLLDDSAVNYQLILTKVDKIKQTELAKVIDECEAFVRMRGAAHPEIIASSSEKNDGIEAIRKEIKGLLSS
ncbi:MAG: ribosome biogenesis GTP-binding protein YihA/YsxC [Rickettsiales bacterium]|nr:ribosome biogenesis GTP-binding protein YihA/YsxC [Rickettsiales bacterium]